MAKKGKGKVNAARNRRVLIGVIILAAFVLVLLLLSQAGYFTGEATGCARLYCGGKTYNSCSQYCGGSVACYKGESVCGNRCYAPKSIRCVSGKLYPR